MNPANGSSSRQGLSKTLIIIQFVLFISFYSGCVNGPSANEDLSNPYVKPRIIFTYPAGNDVGPFNIHALRDGLALPHFVVRFNKLMSRFSLTSRTVTIQGFDKPVVAVLYGNYYYPIRSNAEAAASGDNYYNDVMSFTILDSISSQWMDYSLGQTYTVTIDTTLEDINGNHLLRPFSFSFKPEPYFRVTDIRPKNNTKDASIYYSYPSITFNSPVDSSIFRSLQLSPLPGGHWVVTYSDESTVEFIMNNPLEFGTTYSINISKIAHDKFGNMIDKPYASTFYTAPFKVTYTNPKNNDTWVYLYGSIQIYFSGEIDTASVRPSFITSPNISGYFDLYSNGFNLYPSNGLAPGTTYSITVNTGLRAKSGPNLSESYTFSFTTVPFKIINTSPYDGQINSNRFSDIIITCSVPFDTATVRSSITVTPNPLSLSYNPAAVPNGFSIYDFHGFYPNTTYTVTISPELKSHGVSLPSAYTFSFTTGE